MNRGPSIAISAALHLIVISTMWVAIDFSPAQRDPIHLEFQEFADAPISETKPERPSGQSTKKEAASFSEKFETKAQIAKTLVDNSADSVENNQIQRENENSSNVGREGTAGEQTAAYVTYTSKIRKHLEIFKRYPRKARLQEIQGEVTVGFVIEKSGQLLKRWVERSSGHSILDDAALDAVDHAQPFPQIPNDWPTNEVAFSVPFGFSLSDPE